MKHVKYYNDFINENFDNYDYTTGDLIKINYNNQEYVAKIKNVFNAYSFIVNIKSNNIYDPKEIKIDKSNIIELLDPNNKPAIGANRIPFKPDLPSNDIAINGSYPEYPVPNILNL
jgi:hypothetical protein